MSEAYRKAMRAMGLFAAVASLLCGVKMENIKAKKCFGQNFLHDEATLNKIIQAIPKDTQNIVEIGPGLGD